MDTNGMLLFANPVNMQVETSVENSRGEAVINMIDDELDRNDQPEGSYTDYQTGLLYAKYAMNCNGLS